MNPIDPGNPDCTSGLSERILLTLMLDSRNGFSAPLSQQAFDTILALCWATAKGVAEQINADLELGQ